MHSVHRAKAILACILFTFSILAIPKLWSVESAVSDWQQSVSMVPASPTDFSGSSFQQSLKNFAATGGNYVALIIPYYQSNLYSSSIHAGWNTPTDASLTSAINFAHSMGLNVMLKPHLDSETGEWRALINPSDRNAWFASYGSMIKKYASIAQSTGAEGLTIGAELSTMTNSGNPANTAAWNALIGEVRGMYTGQLTYSAQRPGYMGEFNNITFWNNLDYIGLSAYYPLVHWDPHPTVEALVSEWDAIERSDIYPVYEQYQKPVLFTEIGYRSMDQANAYPWDYNIQNRTDETDQNNLYQALLSYWNTKSYMTGVYWWEWSASPDAGGPGDSGFTPQNKLAEATMTSWFTGGTPGTTTTPTPTPIPGQSAFTVSASVAPSAPKVNQQTNITALVSVNSQQTDVIVDLELYDEANTRVHQYFADHRNLSPGTAQSFSTAFIPNTPGRYTARVGIFTANWSRLLYWEHEAGTFEATTGTVTPTPTSGVSPTPTPTPTTPPAPTTTVTPTPTAPLTPTPTGEPTATKQTDIWWPTDGSAVSGVQPFKALLTGTSLNDYKMYWQVDGDVLNEMHDNQTDYPHKEVLVDVGGWKWKGNGPYAITFVAKTPRGDLITQKSITITTY